MPRFATVVFDCDSTLSTLEGIEELAAAHRPEITRLTEAAMRGDVPLEQVYARRLALIRPDRAAIEALGRRYVETLVEDAAGVVAALREAGVTVRVITGGLLPAVLPLVRHLGLDAGDLAAVDLRFDAAGAYAGFDESAPLARSGGKLVTLRDWSARLPRPILFVGDGATDLEARPAVDSFVAFAGVVERPAVVAAADVVVRDATLAPILALALGTERPDRLPARALYDRGLALLLAGPGRHATESP